MPRKRQEDKPRRGYGEGGIQCITPNEKYRVWASGGTDPNGKRRRPSRIVYGTETAAKRAQRDLQGDLDNGGYIAPDRMTVGDWLEEWLESEYGVTPDMSREELLTKTKVPGRTAETYAGIIKRHLLPGIGSIRLQQLRSTHLRKYFDTVRLKPLSENTVFKHYMLIHKALDAAVRERLIGVNVAEEMTGKPRGKPVDDSREEAVEQCWEASDAQAFLAAAHEHSTLQYETLFTLALDTGARKGELCGFRRTDIDWQAGGIKVSRTLHRASGEPIFGPTKGKRSRFIDLMPETVALLKVHLRHQAEIRLLLGPAYNDHGLIFAKEPGGRTRPESVGNPLQLNNLNQREYARIVKLAGVKPIKFHGLRHTCATMLLAMGRPIKEVSERLGHRDVATTQEIYAHVTPTARAALVETLRRGLGFTE